jgi:hypothetical protein
MFRFCGIPLQADLTVTCNENIDNPCNRMEVKHPENED